MKQFNNIIQSKTEPDVNSLWLNDKTLKIYDNGEWIPLSGESTGSSQAPVLNSEYYKVWNTEDEYPLEEIRSGNIMKAGTEELLILGRGYWYDTPGLLCFTANSESVAPAITFVPNDGSDIINHPLIDQTTLERVFQILDSVAPSDTSQLIINKTPDSTDLKGYTSLISEFSLSSMIPSDFGLENLRVKVHREGTSKASERTEYYDILTKDIGAYYDDKYEEKNELIVAKRNTSNYASLVTTYSAGSLSEPDLIDLRIHINSDYQRNPKDKYVKILTENDLDSINPNVEVATTSKAGIVQIGSGLNITDTGIVSLDTSTLPTKEAVTANTNNIATLTDAVSEIDNVVEGLSRHVDELSTTIGITANIKVLTAAEYEAEERNPEYIYFIKG